MPRIIMIDDEGDYPDMIQYVTIFRDCGFAVGPEIPQLYDGLSEGGIFTDVDDFLGYVDYLLTPNDAEAQIERMEIRAFIVDQKMPPGDRLAGDFPNMPLARNPALTGATLIKYIYNLFANEITPNSIQWFLLSLFEGRGIEPPFEYLSKENGCVFNCGITRRAL